MLMGLTSVDKFFRIFSASSGETVSRMFSRLTNGTENGSLLSRSEYGAATTLYAAVCWVKKFDVLFVCFCNVCHAFEQLGLWTLYCH